MKTATLQQLTIFSLSLGPQIICTWKLTQHSHAHVIVWMNLAKKINQQLISIAICDVYLRNNITVPDGLQVEDLL